MLRNTARSFSFLVVVTALFWRPRTLRSKLACFGSRLDQVLFLNHYLGSLLDLPFFLDPLLHAFELLLKLHALAGSCWQLRLKQGNGLPEQ